MNLRQQLRASHVKRWHIVETTKTQTVAEHSFNVAMIAVEICKLIKRRDLIPEVINYSLHHDLPEVIFGDPPTPTKAAYTPSQKARMEALEASVCGEIIGARNAVKQVVKLADTVEAVLFLNLHGVGTHADKVAVKITEQAKVLAAELGIEGWFDDVRCWDTDFDIGEEVLDGC